MYIIKPIEWKLEKETRDTYQRYSFRNAVSLYYIFRYEKPNSNGKISWSPWFLSISTNDKMYGHWKPTKSIAEYNSIEEAMDVAVKHHETFVKRFLMEVEI